MGCFSARRLIPCASALFAPVLLLGQAAPPSADEVRQLIEQNRQLQQQVAAQQAMISDLQVKVSALQQDVGAAPAPAPAPGGDATLRLSGEAGFGFFDSGSDGNYSNGEFRVDEARVFLDAPVWQTVYFHAETDLATREETDSSVHFGEIYADAENLLGPWGRDNLLNLRVGRMFIPFGEEYQYRYVMDDPLISHSLSDIWGMDNGVEAYGRAGQAGYFFAVQDGGINPLQNFHTDKSFALRLTDDPAPWLHLSASAMRTGRLSTENDTLSALWFDNGFFRSLGPPATTTNFWTDLVEGDATVRWPSGHLTGALGAIRFNDDNTQANDRRDLTYSYVEAVQNATDSLYGAVRFSQIHAPGGYFLTGQGQQSDYLFGDELTSELYRLSVGLGYRFGPPLLLKVEYSPEWGRTTDGEERIEEDLFSTELGLRF